MITKITLIIIIIILLNNNSCNDSGSSSNDNNNDDNNNSYNNNSDNSLFSVKFTGNWVSSLFHIRYFQSNNLNYMFKKKNLALHFFLLFF
jgi:hypothetical protein